MREKDDQNNKRGSGILLIGGSLWLALILLFCLSEWLGEDPGPAPAEPSPAKQAEESRREAENAIARVLDFMEGEGMVYEACFGGVCINDAHQAEIFLTDPSGEAAKAIREVAATENIRITACKYSEAELKKVCELLDERRAEGDIFPYLTAYGISVTQNNVEITLSQKGFAARRQFKKWAVEEIIPYVYFGPSGEAVLS